MCPAGECDLRAGDRCDHQRWSAERLRRWRDGKMLSRGRTRRDHDVLHIEDEPSIEPAAFRRALGEVVLDTVKQEVRRVRADRGEAYINERLNLIAAAEERGAEMAERLQHLRAQRRGRSQPVWLSPWGSF